jgi:hypothetical protein
VTYLRTANWGSLLETFGYARTTLRYRFAVSLPAVGYLLEF